MQVFGFEIIGTHLSLQIETEVSCDELFANIQERLSDFEKKYSRFIPGNWLDELNNTRQATLDTDGAKMLEYALKVAKNTNGYFDPTVGSQLSALGYGRADQAGHHVGYENVEMKDNSILLHEDVRLEFGGVGKGYLIDVIKGQVETLFLDKSLPFPRYMIDFGGDIYARGGWLVGLENPHNLEEVIGTISLDDDFLACSSGSKRKWGKHHHLIDPKTGQSSKEVLATYIEGSSGISTDSYATALAVMPFLLACELLYNSSEIRGVLLASDGRYFRSPESKSELFC